MKFWQKILLPNHILLAVCPKTADTLRTTGVASKKKFNNHEAAERGRWEKFLVCLPKNSEAEAFKENFLGKRVRNGGCRLFRNETIGI